MGRPKVQVIIWGIGRLLEEYIREMNLDEVIAFVDNDSSKTNQMIYGRVSILPSRIQEFIFDYVVIFNQKYREEIHDQLIKLGVDEFKIIGWQYYLYVLKRDIAALSRPTFAVISNVAHWLSTGSVLDVENGIERNGFYIAGTDLRDKFSCIDSFGLKKNINPNIYRKNIQKFYEIEFYDMIICLDYFINHTVEEWQGLMKKTYHHSKYILLTIPYAYPNEWMKWSKIDFSRYGNVMEFPGKTVRLILVKKNILKKNEKSTVIYVASHKEFNFPKNELLVPIFTEEGQTERPDALKACMGDHIKELNPKINELTVLYWIWRNTCTDIVGLCHYRRYFTVANNMSNIEFGLIDQDRIEEDLRKFDMIVTNAVCTYPISLKDQLKNTVMEKAFEMGMKLVRERIRKVCPEYLREFDDCFQGFIMYPCNMFITSWDVFANYCEWLFGIIIDSAIRIDVTTYDSYSQRIIGFIAERLLTVWIKHNGIKIKEYPIVMVN